MKIFILLCNLLHINGSKNQTIINIIREALSSNDIDKLEVNEKLLSSLSEKDIKISLSKYVKGRSLFNKSQRNVFLHLNSKEGVNVLEFLLFLSSVNNISDLQNLINNNVFISKTKDNNFSHKFIDLIKTKQKLLTCYIECANKKFDNNVLISIISVRTEKDLKVFLEKNHKYTSEQQELLKNMVNAQIIYLKSFENIYLYINKKNGLLVLEFFNLLNINNTSEKLEILAKQQDHLLNKLDKKIKEELLNMIKAKKELIE